MGAPGSSRWRMHRRATTVEECRRVAAGTQAQAWAPCPQCRQRVRFLYQPPGQTAYACRRCQGLTYRSRQRHDKAMDALRQMEPTAILPLLQQQAPPMGLILRTWRLAMEWQREEEDVLLGRSSREVVR